MYYILMIRKASLCVLRALVHTQISSIVHLVWPNYKWYYAHIYCAKNPLSRRLRHKLGYLGHRRYLPRNHPWRKSLDFDGEIEDRDALEKFTLEEVLEELEKVKDVCKGKHGGSKK